MISERPPAFSATLQLYLLSDPCPTLTVLLKLSLAKCRFGCPAIGGRAPRIYGLPLSYCIAVFQ